MKRAGKFIGVGLVGLAIAGAVVCTVKKLKKVDNFEDNFDEEDEDDALSEDDLNDLVGDDFKFTYGISRKECMDFIYDADIVYSMEDLESMSDSDLYDIYETLMVGEELEEPKKDTDTDKDAFILINDGTRAEVIENLLRDCGSDDSFIYTKEDLEAMTDAELTAVNADYKVGKSTK